MFSNLNEKLIREIGWESSDIPIQPGLQLSARLHSQVALQFLLISFASQTEASE